MMSQKPQMDSVTPFIDGIFVSSQSDEKVDVINPSTGRRLLCIPAGSAADVDQAVTSARRACEDGRWSQTPQSFRKKVLYRFAELIEAHAVELDRLDAEEMGKPISVKRANAMSAAGMARFCAEAVDKLTGDTYVSDRNSLVMQRRVPRGVVAAITPWNFPTSNAVLKCGPALAAGNSVVLKPSELSSRSAIRVAQLALEAGVPAGVLNVVPGRGEIVGKALALHQDVDMITFTGSTEVGRCMLQYAGQSNLKTVMAECGGKSPHIVFDDGMDLDATAEAIAQSVLTNQGQICSAGSRLLVQRSIAERLIEKVASRTERIVMGDPLRPETTFGPLASAQQLAGVMRYIEMARSTAQLVVGAQRAFQDSGGYFVQPTVFCDVAPDARIAQEEIFGPVLAVIPFDDEAQAVRIANGTRYGLAAYVWTGSLNTGMRMAKAIHSPVWIHAAVPQGEGAGRAASFEPCGLSGIGVEGGLAGIESYLRRQLLSFHHA